jgi:putative FmdB family regulatory protein
MAPLYDFECVSCHHRFEALLRKPSEIADVVCTACGNTELQMRFSAIGGYSIKGDNSASVRPRQAGSFKKGSGGE